MVNATVVVPSAAGSSLRFLITGAGRGIGRGLSRLLLSRGHDVYLVDYDAAELQHTLQRHLPLVQPTLKGRFSGKACDIRDRESVRKAVEEAAKWHRGGRLDVLINNAGLTPPYWSEGQTMETVSLDEWENFLRTNLTGSFAVSQAAIPFLKRRPLSSSQAGEGGGGEGEGDGGSIIHISSTRALQSEANSEGYAATKAGLLGLTHSMACSLGPMGIRVNAIVPGWISVDNECRQADLEEGSQWGKGLSKADHEQHFMGRVGKVEDIAETVEFLARAEFVTGEEIRVDGGMTRKMVYEE